MRTSNKTLAILLNVILFSTISFGQFPDPMSSPNKDTRAVTSAPLEDVQRRRREGEGIRQTMNELSPSVNFNFEQSPETKLKYVKRLELAILSGDISPLLAPTGYSTKFSAFLKDKKTGLARIYPDRNCNYGKTISVEEAERCAGIVPIVGGGSFYSFRLKTNLNQRLRPGTYTVAKGEWADIHYVDGRILAGSDTVQGIIAEINDVDFELINKDSEAVKFLQSYKPENKTAAIQNQKEILKGGINFSKYNYSDSVPAKLNSTYVLRSIAYQGYRVAQLFNKDDLRLLNRIIDSGDLRVDVIIAFKIVGQETDGSLIILWKELKRKDSPVLKDLYR